MPSQEDWILHQTGEASFPGGVLRLLQHQPNLEVAAQLSAIDRDSDRESLDLPRKDDRKQPPRLLQALLRYHGSRKRAVDVLFGPGCSDLDLKQAVDCLTQLCQDKEEWHSYPDVLALVDGRCPYGQKQLLPVKEKMKHSAHMLECRKSAWYREDLKKVLEDSGQRKCWWTTCVDYGETFHPNSLAGHHIRHWKDVNLQCKWGKCGQRFPTRRAVFAHLQRHHRFITPESSSHPF